MSVPLVYLDTQDFSRFGDVLRGKANAETEALFSQLEEFSKAGRARFALSMPIIGELFQYNPDFRETTLCKAEAVERLCGPWALAFPSRLVAFEVARLDRELHPSSIATLHPIIAADRYWFPNVSDLFKDFKKEMRTLMNEKVVGMGLPTRYLRRKAKKMAKSISLITAIDAAGPDLASTYELPLSAVNASLGALVRGKVSPEEASRLLFSHIAEPKMFVKAYFEKTENDGSLPAWMRTFGRNFEEKLTDLRDRVSPYMDMKFARDHLEGILSELQMSIGMAALKMGMSDASEFKIEQTRYLDLVGDVNFASQLPVCKIVGRTLVSYTRQIVGLSAGSAKVERSFGGDLVHAMYLSHVDLWRGDRRFSKVLMDVLPEYADRIVSSLKDLPAAIVRLENNR